MKMTQTLTPGQVQILQRADTAAKAEHRAGLGNILGCSSGSDNFTLQGMTREERQAHLALQGLESTQDIVEDIDLSDFAQDDDVLHGRTALDISHAGEQIPEDEADQDELDLLQELREHHK
jgi:hypothetical protein